jgi:hypothetical protein
VGVLTDPCGPARRGCLDGWRSFLSNNTKLSPSEKLAERQLRPHAFIVRRTPTSHVFFDTVRMYNLCLNTLHPNIGAMNFQMHG